MCLPNMYYTKEYKIHFLSYLTETVNLRETTQEIEITVMCHTFLPCFFHNTISPFTFQWMTVQGS